MFWYWMVLIITHYIMFNTIKNIAYISILKKLFSVKVLKKYKTAWYWMVLNSNVLVLNGIEHNRLYYIQYHKKYSLYTNIEQVIEC